MCNRNVAMSCSKLNYITDILILYPLQVQLNNELKIMAVSKETLHTAEIAQLKKMHQKELKKQVRKKNINKVGIIAVFLLALLIK